MTSNPPRSEFAGSVCNAVEDFLAAMAAAQVRHDGDILADGKIHRYFINGNRKSKRNGWYVFFSDGVPSGAFGSWKTGEKVSWSAKGVVPFTADERRALQAKVKADRERRAAEESARMSAAAAKATAIWDAAKPATDHAYLSRKQIKAHGARVADWVIDRGHPNTGEVKELRIPGALLIKLRNPANKIVSIQAIFPDKSNPLERDKDFLAGGEKRGCWFSIGAPVTFAGRRTVVVAEGFATAASVHEATGIGTVVAFDAGNLQPVAENLRAMFPDLQFIFAADNDRWTLKPIENPGVTRAGEAAAAVGGFVAVPEFKDLSTKATDWNDLASMEGLPVVATQIMAALAAPQPALEPVAVTDIATAAASAALKIIEADKEVQRLARAEKKAAKDAETEARIAQYAEDPDTRKPDAFTVLGHDRTSIFVYSHEMKLVVSHAINSWRNCLPEIARVHWWESEFAGKKEAAENWLIAAAYRKGFYDPAMSRGRGAWIDRGRIVYHFGNKLLVDGEDVAVTAMDSDYVYEQGKRLPGPADTAMSDAEGRSLFELAKKFRWARPGSAILLAGFTALAPVCGALKWRPHIWCTGGAGSGKSTILNDFISVLTAGTALFSQGNSTEAGIRQKLQSDALPVLFDESEQSDEKAEARVQNVLSLARQASSESGAKTYKGTTNGEGQDFLIRSMFCLSSIQVNIKNDADRDRLTVLALEPRHNAKAEDWPALKDALYMLRRDPELPGRLIRRSLDLLPTTLKNIDVFATAAAKVFGSQREGDQYGTLFAGAWSLVNSGPVTPDQADAMIGRYDWTDYVEHTETDDSSKALSAILAAQINVHREGNISVYELIVRARELTDGTDGPLSANATLSRHGILATHKSLECVKTHVFIGNCAAERLKSSLNPNLPSDFVGQMRRLRGAVKGIKPVWTIGGNTRGMFVPIDMIVPVEPMTEPEPESESSPLY